MPYKLTEKRPRLSTPTNKITSHQQNNMSEENDTNNNTATQEVEEECKATFVPLVDLNTLPEVEVKSHEEEEDVFAKLYVNSLFHIVTYLHLHQ
jgi:hypothetical protein